MAPTRDVFVSYASQDSELATAVVLALERGGLSCWIAPRDVVPGDLDADGIIRAITGAKVFVLVLSQHAIASNHVGKEVERASSKRRPSVALRTDTTPLTPALEYFLSESQWIELHAGRTDAALIKLLDAVQRQRRAEAAKPSAYLEASKPVAKRPRKLILALVGSLVFASVLFIVAWFGSSERGKQNLSIAASEPVVQTLAPAAPVISEKSVAVLPFVDMSEKKDQEYFSDGLSEELIDMLTKVSDSGAGAHVVVLLQGKFGGYTDDREAVAGGACARRQRAQVGQSHANHRAVGEGRYWLSHLVADL